MIQKKCFTRKWIESIRDRFHYNDVNLIEKVIRAFSLVEMLCESNCPFIWKGGSSLMLLMGSGLHRLSIDVDIVCPPGTDIEKYLSRFFDYGFTRREPLEREQRGTFIPKSHEKLHYRVAYLSQSEREESILLDILYEESQYECVRTLKVESPFIAVEGDALFVRIPSVDDLLADKLTAFAPNTSGIPYYKNGKPKYVEIIKQLYDIGRLFDNMTNLDIVKNVFGRVAPMELLYRHISDAPDIITQDIRETALCLATRGKAGCGDFEALQKGVSYIRPFMYQGRYYIENAITDAAKAAYLATAIEKDVKSIHRYDPTAAKQHLLPTLTNRLEKLSSFQPEAFYYWALISHLL